MEINPLFLIEIYKESLSTHDLITEQINVAIKLFIEYNINHIEFIVHLSKNLNIGKLSLIFNYNIDEHIKNNTLSDFLKNITDNDIWQEVYNNNILSISDKNELYNLKNYDILIFKNIFENSITFKYPYNKYILLGNDSYYKLYENDIYNDLEKIPNLDIISIIIGTIYGKYKIFNLLQWYKIHDLLKGLINNPPIDPYTSIQFNLDQENKLVNKFSKEIKIYKYIKEYNNKILL
jgi:hypothetical protein